MELIDTLGKKAKDSSKELRILGANEKNAVLYAIAKTIENNLPDILKENKKDVEKAIESGMSSAMIDRLTLSESRILSIADGVRQVASLPDPVGQLVEGKIMPNGLNISQIRVPVGVIGIIYEARPNVTVDSAVLCLKSGNTCILRGGKESFNSNRIFVYLMRESIEKLGYSPDWITFVEDTSRESANAMMKLNQFIDMLIPRGGASLIETVVKNSTVPVIQTGVGNCHIYIDEDADLDMAVSIVDNAKTSRPSVCNAAETLLIHKNIAEKFMPMVQNSLNKYEVELRCDTISKKYVSGDSVIDADELDYRTEFLDYILAIKIVDGLEDAIDHIEKYSTGHSECIVTKNYFNAEKFLNEVDAAAVYVNASTRFTDGGEFGLGAEIGISTQKLHARGPMGLQQLTTVKYLVRGNGQIR